jgi:uncharacterized protein (TIGR00725 family)
MIVAVVGKGKLADGSPLVPAAEAVGAAVVRAGHVLLTGGTHLGAGNAVKNAAMRGAAQAAQAEAPARLVGVLPDGPARLDAGAAGGVRWVHLWTDLRDARNLVNAAVADVLIVVGGGRGTLSEVAFGAIYERPLVVLKPPPDTSPASVAEMGQLLRESIAPALARAPSFDRAAPSEAQLAAALARAEAGWTTAESAAEAVAKIATMQRGASFGKLPLPADLERRFREALAALEAST